MLDNTLDAWFGESVVVEVDEETGVTVTVTVTGPVLLPLEEAVAEMEGAFVNAPAVDDAEIADAVADDAEVDDAEVLLLSVEPGVVASDPVIPPVALVALITARALFSLVQTKSVPADLMFGTAKHAWDLGQAPLATSHFPSRQTPIAPSTQATS